MKRLLIANRGEISRRIQRTARRLGIETVAVYSDADRDLPFVREADQAVRIGPAPARESYLDADRILEAAAASGADAVHPGYGFLSESAAFAERVQDAGLIWVGAPAPAIRAMGLKDAAKALMAKAGVAVTPGYLGEVQDEGRLAAEAARIGWPVLIKAVAGGGGKGMRRVDRPEDFAESLAAARREAAAAFGDDRVLLEVYVRRPRHIEVQVFADRHGGVVHLFERDCSLQRRHQKVIEEAPAPGMDEAARAAVTSAAVRAAEAVGYEGAGTIEFIADASEGLRADRIWFMEMNTRLQVEHPVTEMITGLDLVEWQLRVADGEPLPLAQSEIRRAGWAMEARLYAEAPKAGFLPSIGPLDRLRLPESDADLRVDAGVEEGGEVSPFYDPMIAKIVARGPTRAAAARRLARACAEIEVWPVRTNAGFLARCLEDPDFVDGGVDTGFIEGRLERLLPPEAPSEPAAAAALLALRARSERPDPADPFSPAGPLAGFRLNQPADAAGRIRISGELLEAPLATAADRPARGAGRPGVLDLGAAGVVVFDAGEAFAARLDAEAAGGAGGAGEVDGALRAPMPGRVVQIAAELGARVEKGATILVLEAMKMEHVFRAPSAGIVEALSVAVGDQVEEGAVLARVSAE